MTKPTPGLLDLNDIERDHPLYQSMTALFESVNSRMEREARFEAEQEKVKAKARREAEAIVKKTPVKVNVAVSDDSGIMPNAFNLSSLFLPLNRRSRLMLKKCELVHPWSNCKLTYTGFQLDENDRDVMIVVLHMALKFKLGEDFSFSRYELLKILLPNRKNYSASDYTSLRERLERLRFGMISFHQQYKDGTESFIGYHSYCNLIANLELSDISGRISCCIDPRIAILFSRKQYTLFDMSRRFELKSSLAKNIEQLLHAYKETRVSFKLSWLIKKFGFSDALQRRVKLRINQSCEELRSHGFLKSYKWENTKTEGLVLRIEK